MLIRSSVPDFVLPTGFRFSHLVTKLAPEDSSIHDGTDLYLNVGLAALNLIETALPKGAEPQRILDVACGFGRVSRMLHAAYPTAELTVGDLNHQAVDFTSGALGANGLYTTPDFRDLQIAGEFDLIWAGSFLGRLPEHQTRQFLDFAARHMGPDSRLIVTSNGEHVAAKLRESTYGLSEPAARGLIVQFMNDGYGYRGYEGDHDLGVSLVARTWYENILAGSDLRVESYRECDWNGDQDVLVLRNVRTVRVSQTLDVPIPFFDRPSVPLPLPAAEQVIKDRDSVDGFDEVWYLRTYADVAVAVEAGLVDSGLAHYLASGWKEGRLPFNPDHRYGRHIEAQLNQLTLREMGEAALRNLPFLPGEFEFDDAGLTIRGGCGASSNITSQMAFFVNGRKIEDVTYPISDAAPELKYLDVPGMGLGFSARMPQAWTDTPGSRFMRFDAAPAGCYRQADWRRAIHYMNPALERFAFPPAANMKRTIGDISTERFAMGGATIFNNIGNYLGEMGHDWGDFPNILDWGCGAGRVARYLIGETGCAVTGVDIDSDNIAWCRDTYAGGRFMTVPLRPPTELACGAFDLVVGLSVLTHLQEQDQFLWLEELRRITRLGALLFLSVQGPTHLCYTNFPPQLFRKVQSDGYVDLFRDPALDGVVADTEYYRAAMHSRPYILRRWGEFFEVLDIVDAIATPQDFVVLRRR